MTTSEVSDDPRLSAAPARSDLFDAAKRSVDVVAAAVLLTATLPAVAAVALAFEATSSGPALVWHWRVGRGGRLFRMYGLRTDGSDGSGDDGTSGGPTWHGRSLPHPGALGRLVRALRLDVVPQLWNVVRGDMSLVGPAPERPIYVREVVRAMPAYAERLDVRPGITGLAQVRGCLGHGDARVRRTLAYDRLYLRRAGLLLDARIVLRALVTVPAAAPAES